MLNNVGNRSRASVSLPLTALRYCTALLFGLAQMQWHKSLRYAPPSGCNRSPPVLHEYYEFVIVRTIISIQDAPLRSTGFSITGVETARKYYPR